MHTALTTCDASKPTFGHVGKRALHNAVTMCLSCPSDYVYENTCRRSCWAAPHMSTSTQWWSHVVFSSTHPPATCSNVLPHLSVRETRVQLKHAVCDNFVTHDPVRPHVRFRREVCVLQRFRGAPVRKSDSQPTKHIHHSNAKLFVSDGVPLMEKSYTTPE
eukprot:m.1354581 g.1354581  ORF g.1354581 m.1354581 type:complete len:161 (-) comp24932_c0_seq4:221-703(-)